MSSTTKIPNTVEEVHGKRIPLGEFSHNSAYARRLVEAITLTTSDARDKDTASRWVREMGEGSRSLIYMDSGVRLGVERPSTPFGNTKWFLTLNPYTSSLSDYVLKPSEVVSTFGSAGLSTASSTNCRAVAVMLVAIRNPARANRVLDLYSETLAEMGFVAAPGPEFSTTVTITFDRSSQPSPGEVRDWLADALRDASPRPCGADSDWLGEVTVDSVGRAD